MEEDDDVVVFNWFICVCKDNDICQHMVGLIWKVGIATWHDLVEWSLSDKSDAT